jgi:hypothetical protein
LIFLTPHGRHACDTRLRGGGVAIALGNGREAIRMLWDVLSQFWEVLSREWERRGERARFLKVVELPDKSRQKVSATRSAGSSVRCCPGSEMPHVISTQWPPFSSTTLDNINDGEDVSYCSLGETFYETRLSRYISTAFVCGGSLGSGAPTPFRIEVTQQPTPSFVCESGRAGRKYPYLPAGVGS